VGAAGAEEAVVLVGPGTLRINVTTTMIAAAAAARAAIAAPNRRYTAAATSIQRP
jgi:hypothetical protein